MKDRAPKAYKRLQSNKTLEMTLDNLLAEYVETKDVLKSEAVSQTRTQGSPEYKADPMAATQHLTQAFAMAEETALKQAVERIDALETTESSPVS